MERFPRKDYNADPARNPVTVISSEGRRAAIMEDERNLVESTTRVRE